MEGHPPQPAGDADLVAMADELLEETRALRSSWQHLDRLLAQWGDGDDHAGGTSAPAAAGGAVSGSPDDVARLMAMELAREGRSRSEVAHYLEQTFGLRPDDAMLDEIFN